MTAKVLVLVDSRRFNVMPARRYGELRFLFHNREHGVSPLRTDRFFDVVAEGLETAGFDPEHDHVALTGGALDVALLTAMLMSKYESVSVLAFNARTNQYERRVLERAALSAAPSRRAHRNHQGAS